MLPSSSDLPLEWLGTACPSPIKSNALSNVKLLITHLHVPTAGVRHMVLILAHACTWHNCRPWCDDADDYGEHPNIDHRLTYYPANVTGKRMWTILYQKDMWDFLTEQTKRHDKADNRLEVLHNMIHASCVVADHQIDMVIQQHQQFR